MRSALLFIALLSPMLDSWAGQPPLVTLNDPAGDDHGSGTLSYPQRADFQPGDLDLLQLKVSRDDEGFWFEAMFKNPIRDPAAVVNANSPEPLSNFARNGFYQFNLDVYVDTDRVSDSGNTFTLPGRQVRIAPEYAWEKAVILTPHPGVMRRQLLDAMAEQYPERTAAETEASVDQAMFFPSRTRVRGKSVSFFVPADFFAGSDGKDWAVTGLATGAITVIPADLSIFPSAKKPLDRIALGVMQPAPGHPKDTFGYSGPLPSPVVDLLSLSRYRQEKQLAAKHDLTGISWGAHAVDDAKHISVETIVPTPAISAITSAPAPVVPVGKLLAPDAHSVVRPAEANPVEAPSIAKRLQTLQQLLEQKLIDENEYKQERQRILKAL